ncbi:MAG: hypothetical protein VX725_04315 [Actinomycetota bacterium]|nr:hypothetical protein [Actinomycetota bacterium]MEE2682686.1 hypothetical protein [Actinomycetota bacterium]
MWVYISIAAITVLSLAWFTVVLVSARLRQTPTLTLFDIEKAVDFIAENLPEEVATRVTHDDVRLLLRWEITYFRKRGVASYGEVDSEAEMAALRNDAIVTHEDDLVDELIKRSQIERLGLNVIDIVCVTDLANQYLKGIGAIGDEVSKAKNQ